MTLRDELYNQADLLLDKSNTIREITLALESKIKSVCKNATLQAKSEMFGDLTPQLMKKLAKKEIYQEARSGFMLAVAIALVPGTAPFWYNKIARSIERRRQRVLEMCRAFDAMAMGRDDIHDTLTKDISSLEKMCPRTSPMPLRERAKCPVGEPR